MTAKCMLLRQDHSFQYSVLYVPTDHPTSPTFVKIANWHTSRNDLDSALACYEDALSDVKTFLPEKNIMWLALLALFHRRIDRVINCRLPSYGLRFG